MRKRAFPLSQIPFRVSSKISYIPPYKACLSRIITTPKVITNHTQILCCDAPDYGEGHEEVKLKQLRMPIARGMEGLQLLETLVQTPSELERRAAWVLGMIPPGWDVEIHNERGERTGRQEIAPPGRARRKKRQGIEDTEKTARQQQAEAESVERGEL